MTKQRPIHFIQRYHSQADQIWPDDSLIIESTRQMSWSPPSIFFEKIRYNTCFRGCIQRETWGMRPYMLELTLASHYLIVDFQISFEPQLQWESGGVVRVSPIGLEHLYLSANNGTTNRKRESKKKGGERVGADFYGAWATPCLSWL
jgi:hypothetical protein